MAQKTLVLDASVIVKWYFEEEGSDYAQGIYSAFKSRDVNIAVPSLLYYEVVNAVRYTKITNEERRGIIKSLFALKLESAELSESDFIKATKTAETYDTPIYDSIYLVLAKKLGCKYITADENFCRKIKRGVYALEHWKE